MNIPLVLSAKLGRARMLGRDLCSLRPGDVFVLDSRVSEPISVELAGHPVLRGRPVDHRGNLAVKIADWISPEEYHRNQRTRID